VSWKDLPAAQTDHPETNAKWSARVLPLRDMLLGIRTSLIVLGGAVGPLVVVA
jgi:hypothetical protein